MPPNEPTILLTGASGFLGRAVRRQAKSNARVVAAGRRLPLDTGGLDWLAFDVRDAAATRDAIRRSRPDVVLHLAATMEPHLLEEVIVGGTRAVAEAARQAGARLLHISTDMVFDGEQPPYGESAPASPNTPYGAAKARAEEILHGGPTDGSTTFCIVRTSLLFAASNDDPRTRAMVGRVQRGDDVVLFTDEVRCPALVEDVAQGLWTAALDLAKARPTPAVAHLTGPDALSRWEFGELLLGHLGLPMTGVRAGTIRESGLIRPRDLTLVAHETPPAWRAPIRSPRVILTRAS